MQLIIHNNTTHKSVCLLMVFLTSMHPYVHTVALMVVHTVIYLIYVKPSFTEIEGLIKTSVELRIFLYFLLKLT